MKVQRLAGVLEDLGLGTSEDDIRDMLWLAPQISTSPATSEIPSEAGGAAGQDLPSTPLLPVSPGPPWAADDEHTHGEPASPSGDPGHPTRSLYLESVRDEEGPDGQQATAIRAPAASALGGELQLGRALRPLMRKTASRHRLLLDEEATASRIAEERMWVPALRPAPTRWLELAVVVDGYDSMSIWRQTMIELRGLLERLGAFSDVRFWVLDHAADDPSQPALRRWQAGSPLRSPRELVDPAGRRAIMAVSDCLGPLWQSGAAQQLLAEWGRRGPVAILQPLPQRLWSYTHAPPVQTRLHSVRAGVPNAKLTFSLPARRASRPAGDSVPIPVLELDADWLASWSRLVSASGSTGVDAMVIFGDSTSTAVSGSDATDPEPQQARDQVRRFRATASPEAFQLAVYLAAAPISLPVIRLVQLAMQKTSKQSHVAEVFLGGLLRRIGPDNAADPDAVQYDFRPGVREELLRRLRRYDALRVLKEVSTLVDARFGQARDFPALLAGADVTGDYMIGPESRPFAEVAVRVLRLLGGQYTPAADRLAAALAPADGEAAGGAGAVVQARPIRPATSPATPGNNDEFTAALAETSLPAGRSRERPLVCPYCYHAFGERDIFFRCSGEPRAGHPACAREVDPALRKLGEIDPLFPVFRADGRRDEAVCPACHGSTRIRVCPSCHSRLPANFSAVQGRLIALVGPRQAGKTAFMTVLIHELRHRAGERLSSSIIGADEKSRERYIDDYESRLYKQSMLPKPTTVADEYITPLVFRFIMTQRTRIRQQQKELLLSFTDGAGEDLTRPEKVERVARYLSAADGIMVVVDPLQFGRVRELLRPITELPPLLPAGERPTASFDRITRLLLAGSGTSVIDKPVALVVTKLDMLRPLLPPDSPLRAAAPELPYFDALDSAAVQQQMSDMLNEWDATEISQLAYDNYTRYRFFPTSALGAPPTADNRVPPQGITPYRVTDPFMWLLSEFSFIPARAKQ